MKEMVHTLTTTGEVKADHTLTVTLPEEVPTGRVRVTVKVEPEDAPRKLTPQEFLHSEFFGDWADRDDLPKTTEEFSVWRKKIWEGESE